MASKDEQYDWIDDAFNESKEDPLAAQGMTGCSSLVVVIAVLLVVLIVGFIAIVAPAILDGLSAASSMRA